ncbi:MAG: hypothetical protein JST16_03670 [Bdellovibrionales bacterium]|nr:hypothetical protein [Bdellovibrionales bacterium]
MNSIFESIAGVMMLVLVGTGIQSVYSKIKKESVVRVYRGLSPLEEYTKKLTERKPK